MLPKLALRTPVAGAGLYAGYKLGEGPVAKWLGLRTSPTTPAAPGVAVDHGGLTEAGELLISNSAGNLVMPYFGWTARKPNGSFLTYVRAHPSPGSLSNGCTPYTDPPAEAGSWTPITRGPTTFETNCGTLVRSYYAFVIPFVTAS